MAGGTVIGRVEGGRVRWLAAAGVAAVTALAALATASTPARAGGPGFHFADIGNFQSPVHADNARGFPNLLFVVEQDGVIRVMKDGEKLEDPFLDIAEQVSGGGEEGMLSVAFHPDYEQNRRFYVFYVNNDHDIQVDEFKRRKGRAVRAARGSQRETITIQHDQANNHNGGQLQFRPNGNLYISVGDGGPQGDPEDDAQSTESLLGKILRISPLRGGGYEIPPANPYAAGPGLDEIYALGLRNPYRFSFDRETGALAIGDVGGGAFEEVDYEPAATALGANFGWNDYEGFEETTFGIGANADPYEPPIHAYAEAPGPCEAITGGYVVRDPDVPSLDGRYIYADYCGGPLRTLVPSESGATGDTELETTIPNVSSFAEGAGRQLYVVSHGGDIFALVAGSER